MAPLLPSKKRKAITRDSSGADEVLLSDGADEFASGGLDGILSGLDDSGSEGDEGQNGGFEDFDSIDDVGEDSGDDLASEEIPSDVEYGRENGLEGKANGADGKSQEVDDETPNYTVTQDANGGPRFVYKDIDTAVRRERGHSISILTRQSMPQTTRRLPLSRIPLGISHCHSMIPTRI